MFTGPVYFRHRNTFSSVLSAGLGGWGWGTLYPKRSSIFSAAFLLATFLLGPMPSAEWPQTVTCTRGHKADMSENWQEENYTYAEEESWNRWVRATTGTCQLLLNHLHNKLPAARQTSLCHQTILRFLLLFGLLDLSQPADRIHSLTIFRAGLELFQKHDGHDLISWKCAVCCYQPPAGYVTLIMDLVFFLMRGSVFSTLGIWGSLFNSPNTAAAASFLAIFLLFPSPSPVNSPTVTRTTKLFMWGGPSSFKTWKTAMKIQKEKEPIIDLFLTKN